MMKRLLKNKRGVLSGLFDAIKIFYDSLPKPLKIVMFLLIILLVGSIIQFSFNLMGIFCDASNNPVKINLDIGNLLDIPQLMKTQTLLVNGGDISLNELHIDMSGECSFRAETPYLIYDLNNNLLINASEINLSTDKYFYRVYNPPMVFCNFVYFYEQNVSYNVFERMVNAIERIKNLVLGFKSTTNMVCLDYAYPVPVTTLLKNVTLANAYGGLKSTCMPPDYYRYNPYDDIYECEPGVDCVGKSADRINRLLYNDFKAKLIYPEGADFSSDYKRFASVACSDYSPRIAVFGIQIFDYKLWLFIFVLSILWWIYVNLKRA